MLCRKLRFLRPLLRSFKAESVIPEHLLKNIRGHGKERNLDLKKTRVRLCKETVRPCVSSLIPVLVRFLQRENWRLRVCKSDISLTSWAIKDSPLSVISLHLREMRINFFFKGNFNGREKKFYSKKLMSISFKAGRSFSPFIIFRTPASPTPSHLFLWFIFFLNILLFEIKVNAL